MAVCDPVTVLQLQLESIKNVYLHAMWQYDSVLGVRRTFPRASKEHLEQVEHTSLIPPFEVPTQNCISREKQQTDPHFIAEHVSLAAFYRCTREHSGQVHLCVVWWLQCL